MKEYNFETTPIVDIANNIIIDAVKMNASDIHFDPAENYLKIRIRIDGELRDYSIVANKYKRNLITRIKLLSGMNITESRLPQDGAIKSNINGKDLDLRVSALPTSFGEKVVVRILDYSLSFEGIEALGFTKENYKIILEMLANPNGIILVTGATGSGKSTTVYSMLQKLNKENTNIITVEDPIEMNIEGINQVQVNSEIGLDFGIVLRSILRQDPNIILIGEIRDSETAQIAIRASITGHLVLSTLHTNNSLTTIERLLDMDVERYLLSSSLKGIISQNLAKKLCEKCRRKRPTTETEKRMFEKALHTEVNEIYEPVGCPNCHEGYKGRIAIQEVLLINDEIRDAINEGVPRSELRNMIYSKGVKTLFQDGLIKVLNGITSFEEVFRIVDVEDDADNIYGKEKNIIQQKQESLEEKAENDKKIITPEEPKAINQPLPKIEDKQIIETPKSKEEPIEQVSEKGQSELNYLNNKPPEEQPKSIINNEVVNENQDTDLKNLFDSLRVDEPKEEIIDQASPVIDNKSKDTPINEIKKENNDNNSYTEDLINLINQGFFE